MVILIQKSPKSEAGAMLQKLKDHPYQNNYSCCIIKTTAAGARAAAFVAGILCDIAKGTITVSLQLPVRLYINQPSIKPALLKKPSHFRQIQMFKAFSTPEKHTI